MTKEEKRDRSAALRKLESVDPQHAEIIRRDGYRAAAYAVRTLHAERERRRFQRQKRDVYRCLRRVERLLTPQQITQVIEPSDT